MAKTVKARSGQRKSRRQHANPRGVELGSAGRRSREGEQLLPSLEAVFTRPVTGPTDTTSINLENLDRGFTRVQIAFIAEVLEEVGIERSDIAAALSRLQSGSTLQRAGSSGSGAVATVAAPIPVQLRKTLERRRQQALQHFEKGLALEDTDIEAARAAYMAALALHADHLEARINLGRLLHLQGQLEEAEKIYRAARHASAELSFNLAVLLEDLDREAEAIVAYRQALALDPAFHDAHFNLSRLHERANQPKEAFRHLLAYRRHTRNE